MPLAFGTARVTLVDARDIGAAAAAALVEPASDGGTYTLTGPAVLTGDELVTAVADALGTPLTHLDLRPDELANRLQAAGAPPATVAHLAELFGYFRTGGLDITTDDVATLTGHPPRTLRDALSRNPGPASAR